MDELKKKIIRVLLDKDQFDENAELIANEESLYVDFTHWKKEFERGKDLSVPYRVGWMIFGGLVNVNGHKVDLSPRADENKSPRSRGCFMLVEDSTGTFVRVIKQAGSNIFSDKDLEDDFDKFYLFMDSLKNLGCRDILIREMFTSRTLISEVKIKDCMFSAEKVGMDAERFVISIDGEVIEGDMLTNGENSKKIIIRENINGTIYVCSAFDCDYITRDELMNSKWYNIKVREEEPKECIVSLDFLKRIKNKLEDERRI